MIWMIMGVLLVLWLIGAITNLAGGIIHILLLTAVILFLVQFILNRRSI
ncbi:lmo0937 family membrane protein [Siminovitchia acidinfaciens]|uniref:Lmo0937 family membrane protein n=1 Tax=Siminovitchia acidinfaciens TaxID=2321395 RepID=A0A429Y8H0_9BACI|nr:lmo0937 family membrane protein [Siminovitchia acidinfaciens]RST77604.1 lmo0937 family membrane protein [Siminovitchia acidinfaciens]